MKRREIVSRLEAEGFVAEEGSNHTVFRHPDGRVTVVARHREIPTGTVRMIERQTRTKLLPR